MFLPWSTNTRWLAALSRRGIQTERGNRPARQRAEVLGDAQDLAARTIRELAQKKPLLGKFSEVGINGINRLIRDLKRQGRAGVTAICEFLQTGQDATFAEYKGNSTPEHSSQRLAMIDLLGEIGGQEATDFVAGMLPATTHPDEVATLARELETSAPRTYRTEILRTILTRLDQTLNTPLGNIRGSIISSA